MKTFDLTKLGVQEMNSHELKTKEGGTTCPTYDIKDNYDGARTAGSFLVGFIQGLFGL